MRHRIFACRPLRAVALAALAGVLAAAAAAPAVREIRFWTAPDHTRIVLDMSASPRYSIRTLTGPHRIVIELPGCRAGAGVAAQEVRDGVLDRIRVNRVKSGLQIVLDVPRATAFEHFTLKAADGKPHRIVVDLTKSFTDREIEEQKEAAKRVHEGARSVVAIDAGHGGDAPGAVSRSGIQEKRLNLKLARMLKEEIERVPGMRAVLVRDGDYDVVWYKRITIARERGGDVFVSLHFNSASDTRLRGIELYLISPEGVMTENAESVAEREHLMNEVQQVGDTVTSELESILFDVSRTNAMQQSALLAEEIARSLQKSPPIPYRRINQKNFIVLRGISMPSILVEGGYLSNRTEAAIISKDEYLRWLAKQLAAGIVSFLEKHPPADSTGLGD